MKCDETIEKILLVFFRQNPQFTLKHEDVSWEELTLEGALLIRVYCAHSSASMDEDRIDNIIPNLSQWVDLLASYKDILKDTADDRELLEYILLQLLRTVECLNLSDETGRQNLLILLSLIRLTKGNSSSRQISPPPT